MHQAYPYILIELWAVEAMNSTVHNTAESKLGKNTPQHRCKLWQEKLDSLKLYGHNLLAYQYNIHVPLIPFGQRRLHQTLLQYQVLLCTSLVWGRSYYSHLNTLKVTVILYKMTSSIQLAYWLTTMVIQFLSMYKIGIREYLWPRHKEHHRSKLIVEDSQKS